MTPDNPSSAESLSQEQIREFVVAAHGQLDVVQTLLAGEPALLNASFAEWDETALAAAAHTGQRDVVEFLLAAGAPLTICAAAMLGRTQDVAAFLAADPTQVNARGAHGIPLMFHAALSGQTGMAELLMAHGGDESVSDALHGAVAAGHLAMAEWLIAYGAEVNALNWQQKTPLAVAEENGHTALAELLRKHGGTM